MPCVRNCCCCVDLRVGGIMMGVMTLALSVFSIVPMAISLANRDELARTMTHLVDEYTEKDKSDGGVSMSFWGTVASVWDRDTVSDPSLPRSDDPRVERLSSAMLVFFIVAIVVLLVYAVCSVLLVWGSYKGRRWLLLPWIVVTLALVIAYLAGMCLSLWLVGIQVVSVLMFFVALIEVVIAFYLWTCVVSLHQLLGSDEWRRENNMEMRPKFTTKYEGVPQN